MFRVRSLADAAQLVQSVAGVPGVEGSSALLTVAGEHAEARCAAALAAGGRIVDESEAPRAWILADRAGHRVCLCAWPDGAVPA